MSRYPQVAPGELTSLQAQGRKLDMTGMSESGTCDLQVWIPGDQPLELTSEGVTDIQTEQVDGGWIVTGCAKGAYELHNGISMS